MCCLGTCNTCCSLKSLASLQGWVGTCLLKDVPSFCFFGCTDSVAEPVWLAETHVPCSWLLWLMQVVLRKLCGADPDGRRHCIKLLRTFEYRGHLCLAFEAMVMHCHPCYMHACMHAPLTTHARAACTSPLFKISAATAASSADSACVLASI